MIDTARERIYNYVNHMVRPFLPDGLRKTKMLPIRFTETELGNLKKAAKRFGIPISKIVREGVDLYLKKLEQTGRVPKRKEKK